VRVRHGPATVTGEQTRNGHCESGKAIVLKCRCGQKLLLLGREADWRKEGRIVFECSGCGKRLSLTEPSRKVLKSIEV
jgi:hypothetical protein